VPLGVHHNSKRSSAAASRTPRPGGADSATNPGTRARRDASLDTGTGSAVGWINLTTLLLRRFASFGCAALHGAGDSKGGVLRIPSAVGCNRAPSPSRANRPPMRGTPGHQNRHALQSGDRFRPCQPRKKRRCPRGFTQRFEWVSWQRVTGSLAGPPSASRAPEREVDALGQDRSRCIEAYMGAQS
jgi:hypothetical protein